MAGLGTGLIYDRIECGRYPDTIIAKASSNVKR